MSSAQILDTTRPAYVWNGTNWVPITQTRNDAVLYQPTQPDVSALDVGTVWVDSNDYLGTGIVNPHGFGYITTTPATQQILADSDFDNLNIEAGTSITLNAASATNTLTISSTITNLNSLIDTTIASPSNNQLLAYNSASTQFTNQDVMSILSTANASATLTTTWVTGVLKKFNLMPNVIPWNFILIILLTQENFR
jgi:hypothetical protein